MGHLNTRPASLRAISLNLRRIIVLGAVTGDSQLDRDGSVALIRLSGVEVPFEAGRPQRRLVRRR